MELLQFGQLFHHNNFAVHLLEGVVYHMDLNELFCGGLLWSGLGVEVFDI
jgi:hypothetical protein